VAPEGSVLIDPFDAGRALGREELLARLRGTVGEDADLEERHFHTSTKRQILTRLLTNLRAIYHRVDDDVRALAVIEKLAILNPDDAPLAEEKAALRKRSAASTN
jgi:regulator of sirC expression with transglutaminase-like and TPR domain